MTMRIIFTFVALTITSALSFAAENLIKDVITPVSFYDARNVKGSAGQTSIFILAHPTQITL